MNGFPYDYIIILLAFLLGLLIIALAVNKEEPKRRNRPKPKIKAKSRNDEVLDTLDWMMQNQIITSAEYTKLIGKCLPFFEG